MTATPAISLPLFASPSISAPAGRPMSFTGQGGDFIKLLLRGALLQIPTFGFYRFWLVTQLRRHLWANTRVGSETFEYTGTAKEILIGFLIALAILTPIYVAYALLGLFAEQLQAFASLPLLALLYVLGQFASYRGRRYRATRTTFRGLRFWMTGSGWAYAGKAVLWDLLTLVTLGLAYPWRTAALERYLMRNTYFGSLQGDFVGTGGTLFRRGAWIWLLNVSIVAFVGFTLATGGSKPGPHQLVLLLLIAVPITIPLFLAIQARWRAEGVQFGPIAVSSTLSNGAFLTTFVKLLFSNIALLGAFAVVAGALSLLFASDLGSMSQSGFTPSLGVFFALMALTYLALLVGFSTLQRYFMSRGLWAILVGTLSLTGLGAIEQVVAAGQPVSGVGEGLADAFDLSGV